jgi:REP element-mobilizing transposase RayT
VPRRRREDAPGAIHHVWARGIEGRAIFRHDGDQLDLLERLAEVFADGCARCFVWALMGNHLHLVLRTGTTPLSTLMRRIHTGFALRFNLRYGRSGYLFQSRFGSRMVHDEAGLRAVIRYVLRNPLEAGLVRDLAALERFRWCAYGALVGVRSALPFEAVSETLSIFGESTAGARAALRAFVAEDVRTTDASGPARLEPGPLLGALVREICREHDILEDDLRGAQRTRAISRARTELCRRAVLEHALRPATVARGLGLSESAVSQALRRAVTDPPPESSEDGGPAPS